MKYRNGSCDDQPGGVLVEKCLELIEDLRVCDELPSYLLFRRLGSFKGPENVRALVANHIEMESARRRAKLRSGDNRQTAESVRTGLIRCLNNYFSLIQDIAEYVCHRVTREFAAQNLRVVQIRVKFDFRSWLVNMLFIIDGDREGEEYFLRLLNEIEKYVLLEECFVPSILHINKREGIIDSSAVRRAYSFVLELPNNI